MIRVVSAIVGTVAALVLLLSFKSQSPLTATAGLPKAALHSSVSAPAATTSAAPPDPSAATGSGAASDTPSTSAIPATPTPTPTPVPAAASASAGRDYDGQAVTTRYGVIQVRVTVTGSTITNVAFLQLTAFDRRSQEINASAADQLLQETLSAQSAHIDSVSGASYTSEGYLTSLQSALDAAGLR